MIPVKYKSVTINVYPIRRPDGKTYHQFLRADGRQATRATVEKAKRDALVEAQTIFKGGLSIDDLTGDQVRAIKRMLEADPDLKFVDEFLVWHGRKAPKKRTGEAIDEFLLSKQQNQGLSKLNHTTLKGALGRLKPIRDTWLADVAVCDLPELTGAPRTRLNIRRAWITFFKWAAEQEYLPHGEKTAPERLAKPIIAREAPATYTPLQLAKLLQHVSPEFLTWLACCSFGGFRSSEICPRPGSGKSGLDWSDFKWDRSIIVVRAETSKTGHRRIVPILPALEAWLLEHRLESGRVCTGNPASSSVGPGETRKLGKLIGGWKNNALRHSWISYRAAVVGLAQTAMEAGNSEAMARKAYNDAMGRDSADQWFGIRPG